MEIKVKNRSMAREISALRILLDIGKLRLFLQSCGFETIARIKIKR